MRDKKVIIIGSGIAGVTCGLYLARAGIKTKLITGDDIGGNTAKAVWIENYTGFPDGVAGDSLMANSIAQAERAGVEIVEDSVVNLDIDSEQKSVELETGTILKSDYIVIQTGTTPKALGLPDERKMLGKGFSYCVLCDGGFYNNTSSVGIVGGGNTAIQSALYMSTICKEVHLFVRKDRLVLNQNNQNKLYQTPNIQIHYGTSLIDYTTHQKSNTLKSVIDQNNNEYTLDGLFIQIGTKPNTDIVKGLGLLDENGYILTWSRGRVCNGVYATGSCVKGCVDQAITSAGNGACVALGIINDIK